MSQTRVVCLLLLCLPMLAWAEPDEEKDPSPQHHLQRMSEKLLLSDEQKTQVEKIFAEQHQKILAIHEESHNRIKEVLNAEQAEKWEAMKKAHEERRAQRKH